MLHIDPETLRRHPWIGVALGFASAAFIGFLLQSGLPEARALFAQKAPEVISVDRISSVHGARWVRITDGAWHCDRAVTIEQSSWIARLLLGPVETTEVPISGAIPGKLVVACFDGAVSCETRARSPLTGVVGSRVIFTSSAAKARWSRSGEDVAVLNVGASPQQALLMMFGIAAVAVVGVGFGAYYLRLMIRSAARPRATSAAYVPIEPR